jgi:hypothetical protein
MKSIFASLVVLFVLASCGKYEKPFISLRSAEKRITNKTWNCTNVIDVDGNEFQITDRIKFEISGNDSIFTRITDYSTLNINSANQIDTVVGTWTWLYALDGKVDKQRLRVIYPGFNRVLKIRVLTSKELEYKDESFNNSSYIYEVE